ncbi:MAG: carboxylesterase family protein [Myxococcales bacterium]|nr:carboxylesterase family protein [Myxococcales bacterium]
MKRAIAVAAATLGLLATVLILRCGGRAGPRAAAPPVGAPTTVEAPAGPVQGILAGELRVFLGIPYAAPPVGASRFRPPQPAAHFATPFDASHYGPVCPQLGREAESDGEVGADDPVDGSEDCLHLNVWTHADERARPVMVFIHGGGFQQGSNSKPYYEGSNLARAADVVIVTVNYRLGVLGFLAHEALAAESPEGSAGNYGLRDQVAALGWVRDNIAAFGGDPNNVTIFGESAGAMSVCALVASPLARGLFARAIAQSGGGCHDVPSLREDPRGRGRSGFARGLEVARAAGCADTPDLLACLRSRDAASLVRAGAQPGAVKGVFALRFGPVVDGAVLTATPFERARQGGLEVPLVAGSNADEATIFMPRLKVTSAEGYATVVRDSYPEHADALLGLYPADGDAWQAPFARLLTEVGFVCPQLALVEAASAGPQPAYAYYFTRRRQGPLGRKVGAFHGVELAYLFWPFAFELGEDDALVTKAMRAAWGSFARRGAPDVTPAWPAFRKDAPSVYRIDVRPAVVADPSEGRCASLRAAGVVPTP